MEHCDNRGVTQEPGEIIDSQIVSNKAKKCKLLTDPDSNRWEERWFVAPSLDESAWQRDGVIPGQLRECHTRITLVTNIRTLNEMLIGEESKNFNITRFLNQFSHDCDSSKKYSEIFFRWQGQINFYLASYKVIIPLLKIFNGPIKRQCWLVSDLSYCREKL